MRISDWSSDVCSSDLYSAFNSHGFDHSTEFTTDDWNHINPYGGRTRGRMNVLKELHEVHGSFLNGVSDNIAQADVSFASKDVAVATVASRMSPFTIPDGIKPETQQHRPEERRGGKEWHRRRNDRW